jgi:hypothetical protein
MKKIAIIAGLAALVTAGPALTDEYTDKEMREQQVAAELAKLLPPITQEALDRILIIADQTFPPDRQQSMSEERFRERERFLLFTIRVTQIEAPIAMAKARFSAAHQ